MTVRENKRAIFGTIFGLTALVLLGWDTYDHYRM